MLLKRNKYEFQRINRFYHFFLSQRQASKTENYLLNLITRFSGLSICFLRFKSVVFRSEKFLFRSENSFLDLKTNLLILQKFLNV